MNNSLFPQATQAMVKELITLETYVDEQNTFRIKLPENYILSANQVLIEWLILPKENIKSFARYLSTIRDQLEYYLKELNARDKKYQKMQENSNTDRAIALDIYNLLMPWYGASLLSKSLDDSVLFDYNFIEQCAYTHEHKINFINFVLQRINYSCFGNKDSDSDASPVLRKEIYISPKNIELIYNALVPYFAGSEERFKKLLEGQPISGQIKLNGSAKEYAQSFCFLALDKKIDSDKDDVMQWFCKYFIQKDGRSIATSTGVKYFAHYQPKPNEPMFREVYNIIFGKQT